MQGRQMSEAVEFEWGTPVLVCLKYAEGKRIQTTGGRTRFLFTLTDGRVMFHDEPEAERMKQFGAGVPFYIQRNRGQGKGAPPIWNMWQGNAPTRQVEQQLDPQASQLERDLARSIDHVQSTRSGHGALAIPAPPPEPAAIERKPAQVASTPAPASSTGLRPETQLEDALFTTIRSCHRSHEYARQLGYASMPQFTGEDIRAMAITILIGKQERRGAA